MRRIWAIRLISVAICFGICTLIIYRIFIWYSQHMINSVSINQDVINESKNAAWSLSQIPITLCNLNPLKGYALFKLHNGSQLYDDIMDKWQKELISYSEDLINYIPKSIIRNTSHSMHNMLRWCYFGSGYCNPKSFRPIWYQNRFCYQIILQRKDTSLTLALDPEEKHYLIPGYGFVGFKLCIGNIRQKNSQQHSDECFYISNRLHTIITVSRSVLGEDPQCAFQLYDQCKSQCLDLMVSNCSCSNYIQFCQFSYYISSNLQAAPSPFLAHLTKMESYKRSYHFCDQLVPDLIQWRAVLRFTKPALFLHVKKLSHILYNIQKMQRKTFSFINTLQQHISSDLERLSHIRDNSRLCDLPATLYLLNVTCTLFHNKYADHNNSLARCIKTVAISGYFELAIIEILFSSTELPLFDPSFRKKLNQLSMLNLEFVTKSSKNTCINKIIQKMGAYYSQQISNSISMLIDYSHKCQHLQSGVISLKNVSLDIITSILQKHQSNDVTSLVTVTIDIFTNPYSIASKPMFHKQNVLSVSIIAELIDIICSTTAVAALFILIIKCLKSRLKIRSAMKPRKRIKVRLSERTRGTSQTEIIRDDIIIRPVTFSL